MKAIKDRPMFKVELLDYKTLQKLFREDREYILIKSQYLILKNIGKYNLK